MSRLDIRLQQLQKVRESQCESDKSDRESSQVSQSISLKLAEVLSSDSDEDLFRFKSEHAGSLSEKELSAISEAISRIQKNNAEIALREEKSRTYRQLTRKLDSEMLRFDVQDELSAAIKSGDGELMKFVLEERLDSDYKFDIGYILLDTGGIEVAQPNLVKLFMILRSYGFDLQKNRQAPGVIEKILSIANGKPWLVPLLFCVWLNVSSRDEQGRNLLQIVSLAGDTDEIKTYLIWRLGVSAFTNVEGCEDIGKSFLISEDFRCWSKYLDYQHELPSTSHVAYLNKANAIDDHRFLGSILDKYGLPRWTSVSKWPFPGYVFENAAVNPEDERWSRGSRSWLSAELSEKDRLERIRLERDLIAKFGIDIWTDSFIGNVFDPAWPVVEFKPETAKIELEFRTARAENYVRNLPQLSNTSFDRVLSIAERAISCLTVSDITHDKVIGRSGKGPIFPQYEKMVSDLLKLWSERISAVNGAKERGELLKRVASIVISIPGAFPFNGNALSIMQGIRKDFELEDLSFVTSKKKNKATATLLEHHDWDYRKYAEILRVLGISEGDEYLLSHELPKRMKFLPKLTEYEWKTRMAEFQRRTEFFIECVNRWYRFDTDPVIKRHPENDLLADANTAEVKTFVDKFVEKSKRHWPQEEFESTLTALGSMAGGAKRLNKEDYVRMVSLSRNPFEFVVRHLGCLLWWPHYFEGTNFDSINREYLLHAVDRLGLDLRFARVTVMGDENMSLAMACFIHTYWDVQEFEWIPGQSAYSLKVYKGFYDSPRVEQIKLLWEILKRTDDAFETNYDWFRLCELWNENFIVRERTSAEWIGGRIGRCDSVATPELQRWAKSTMDSYFTPKAEPNVRPGNGNVAMQTEPKKQDAVAKGIRWIKKLVN